MKKVFLFPLAAFLFAVTSCSDNKANVKGMSTEAPVSKPAVPEADARAQHNKQTIIAMFDAMNKHDVAGVSASWAADCKDYGDGSGKPVVAADTKAMIGNFFTAFPDFKSETQKVMADGDMVMIWSEQSGTWTGYYMNQKPTGKSFKGYDVDIFRFDDAGKVTEHHNVQPFATIAEQIGFKLK